MGNLGRAQSTEGKAPGAAAEGRGEKGNAALEPVDKEGGSGA